MDLRAYGEIVGEGYGGVYEEVSEFGDLRCIGLPNMGPFFTPEEYREFLRKSSFEEAEALIEEDSGFLKHFPPRYLASA
jgi:hypothetical protein